ncbi:hypothetical protein KUTeg_020230 [Tegillarca granosa]|uniref:Uncharacterized protein n=1 Tax=Tegillarca granosa TaxID=220873 RepID=A0ABQ9ED91_TEGGR|nr:hypothetical protein KUTeg_020230 [Tegillarca granosa]
MITDFCYIFNRRMTQYSIRGQLISYYNSILRLLEDFPSVRETYFMLGEPFEKKTNVDGPDNLIPDPKTSRKRPRQLLSNDGKHVLNIWFIPHHTEALVMFKKLSDESCVSALSYSLLIVSSLHDILQYLCAHSRLGSSHARLGTRKMEFVSADWGGTEGIGSELREIQKQIDNLPVRTDPQSVAEFLSLRRDVMFLEFDTAVRHSMSDTFLSTGNLQAFKSIQNNIHHALPSLSNIQKATLGACHLNVPEPLEPRDIQARELYPWRAFLGRNGPFPMMFWQWHLIEFNIQLCLAGLKDVDRHVANGEILGVTLLMEDVLQSGYMENLGEEEPPDSPKSEKKSAKSSSKAPSRAASRMDLHRSSPTDSGKTVVQRSLNRTQEPIESYKLLKFFLMLWKCLEYVKNDWGKRKFMVEQIDDTNLYKDFCKAYKSEILLPVLQSVARRLGRGEMYEGIELDTDPLVMPKGASEIEVRSQQMIKLLETFECHMITEIRKKIAKELTLAVAERAREEPAEPTDLWKRPVMKESFTLAKPHVAESFVLKLMEECEETDDTFVFTKEHLNSCVAELARSVMAREKHNFESYTMYYENLLRVHHQLLYQSEQEVKNLKQQVKQSQGNVTVEVKCQLANYAHDLLMEITALRAKIAEMREMSLTQETDIRDRVRQEYEDLIENLFECSTKLKDKFDDFREELHDDVVEKINKAKWATLEEFKTVREKAQEDADDLMAERDFARTEQLRDLQHENHSLNILVLKMKAMNNWTQNHNNVKHKKILKEKMEKTHEAIQRARSQKQLEQAKQANIEKLLGEVPPGLSQPSVVLPVMPPLLLVSGHHLYPGQQIGV